MVLCTLLPAPLECKIGADEARRPRGRKSGAHTSGGCAALPALEDAPARRSRAASYLIQDNEFVYKGLLGYSDDEVTQFLIDGVITTEHDVPAVLKLKEPK